MNALQTSSQASLNTGVSAMAGNLQVAEEPKNFVQIFQVIPTLLTASSKRELAACLSVNSLCEEEIVKCAVHISSYANDIFKEYFKHDSSKIDFINIFYAGILGSNTLSQIYEINNRSFKPRLLSFLLNLKKEDFNNLKQEFIGTRLPVGLENIFQEVEDYHLDQERQAVAAVGGDENHQMLDNQALFWQSMAMAEHFLV